MTRYGCTGFYRWEKNSALLKNYVEDIYDVKKKAKGENNKAVELMAKL